MCCPWVFPFIVAAYDVLSVSICGEISNLSSPGATGVLPVAIEEDEDTLRHPPTKPAPPVPPRGTVQDEDQDLPTSLPPPLSPDDIPPSLPPPLAPEDIPPSPPPPLAPEDVPLSGGTSST